MFLSWAPRGELLGEQKPWKLPRETGQRYTYFKIYNELGVIQHISNIRFLRVASIGFSDIKHGNEHSLVFCVKLEGLLVFKNIHIHGQGESSQSLLADESFICLQAAYKGRVGLWQRKVGPQPRPVQLA